MPLPCARLRICVQAGLSRSWIRLKRRPTTLERVCSLGMVVGVLSAAAGIGSRMGSIASESRCTGRLPSTTLGCGVLRWAWLSGKPRESVRASRTRRNMLVARHRGGMVVMPVRSSSARVRNTICAASRAIHWQRCSARFIQAGGGPGFRVFAGEPYRLEPVFVFESRSGSLRFTTDAHAWDTKGSAQRSSIRRIWCPSSK